MLARLAEVFLMGPQATSKQVKARYFFNSGLFSCSRHVAISAWFVLANFSRGPERFSFKALAFNLPRDAED